MTLIVSRIEGNKIFIESDSKITDNNIVRTNPLCGLMKTFILHPFVSVSFAGNVHYAEQAVKNFYQYKINDINIFINMLINVNRESENSTDFIVATMFEGIPKLYKIHDGLVESHLQNAWIGDIDGFNIYQNAYHSIPV